MKPAHVIGIVTCTAVAAFLVGRMMSEDKKTRADDGRPEGGIPTRIRGQNDTVAELSRQRKLKDGAENTSPENKVEQARRMSREERLALIAKGAKVSDAQAQRDLILGVIGALQAEEMREAVDIIGKAQRSGNYHAPEIWSALWNQWGRVAPEDCFARFRERPEGKGREDVRNTMRGWLETDPATALAWARQPDLTALETSAAALAISHHAEGDPARIQAAVLEMPEGQLRKETLRELYEIESIRDGGRAPAKIYAELPDTLKADAWSLTAQQLAIADQEAAKAWLSEHAGEPGTNYRVINRMVADVANEDAVSATKWAASLPDLSDAANAHPVTVAAARWFHTDANSFKVWLESQPQDQAWVKQISALTATETPR